MPIILNISFTNNYRAVKVQNFIMAWNYQQKEFVIQLADAKPTDANFLTIRICKSMNDELHVRICDEKAFGLDNQGRYNMFLQMVEEFETRNKKKGVNPRPKRSQHALLLNDVMQRMTINLEGKNDDGDGVATHIMVEGIAQILC